MKIAVSSIVAVLCSLAINAEGVERKLGMMKKKSSKGKGKDNKHDGCMYLYEKEFSGTLEGQDFAGVTESGVADTPVFASLEDAQMGKYVFGRVQASFECIDEGATCFGIWNIYDAYYHSWISFRFGFGEKPTANTIVGGTGVYAGITGEVSSKPVSTDPPIFEFAICHY